MATIAIIAAFGAFKLVGRGAAATAAPPIVGGPASYVTAVDEPKANELFRADRGKDACRKSCPVDDVLVANCLDGSHVYAPPGLYVRGRRDTGGYEHRKTDPEPIVVPLSYDWCEYP